MILVVAATRFEVEQLAGAETLVCGIGPVEAAAATARALAERRPDALLHVGIAGARGIAPPAVVLGSEAIYWVSMVNPFTHAVEMIRFALYGMFEPVATLVVVVSTVIFFMLAVYGYDPQRGMLRRAAPAQPA